MHMGKQVYRFSFNPEVSMQDVESFLLLAVLAAEGLHGKARVRLDAAYGVDEAKRSCVVDASTQVGQDVAAIFAGFAQCVFGPGAVRVDRAAASPPPDEAPCACAN
jgi:hypothetical protein